MKRSRENEDGRGQDRLYGDAVDAAVTAAAETSKRTKIRHGGSDESSTSSDDGRPSTSDDPVKESDLRVLTALKSRFEGSAGGEQQHINEKAEEIKRKYLVNYMKKVIEKLPMSQDLIDTSVEIEDENEFLKIFSIAKTCVHSEMQLRKMMAFNMIFDMLTNLIGKGIHEHFVVPLVGRMVSRDKMNAAFNAFRKKVVSDDDGISAVSTELHCVTFLIQEELAKDKPLKIPNPIYSRLSQQVTAVSQYVTSILSSLADCPMLPAEDDEDYREYERIDRKNKKSRKNSPTVPSPPSDKLTSPDFSPVLSRPVASGGSASAPRNNLDDTHSGRTGSRDVDPSSFEPEGEPLPNMRYA